MSRSKKRSRPLAEYPLVLVEWIDASRISDGWTDMQEVPAPQPHKCVSAGFLVRENKLGKIIIPTIADMEHPDNRHVYGSILIPTAAILSVKRLR